MGNQSLSHSSNKVLKVSKAAALLVLIIGFIVLLGWILDIPVLKSILPNFVSMKFNTALAFVFSGVALLLFHIEGNKIWIRQLTRLCAAIVTLIGGLSFFQYIFGIDFGLDQLLIREAPGALNTSHPGRMSPATAFNFLFFGMALLLDSWRKLLTARVLVIIVAFVAIFAFLGYLLDVSTLYSIGPYTSMALHTSITFILIAISYMSARKVFNYQFIIRSGFWVAILAFAFIGVTSYWNTVRQTEDIKSVTHTRNVLQKLTEFLSDIKDVETGVRGFVITGDEQYLEPYYAKYDSIETLINELRGLTSDNPHQQRNIDLLEPIVKNKIVFIHETMNLRKTKGLKAIVIEQYNSLRGKRFMDEIRSIVGTMINEENKLMMIRNKKSQLSSLNTIRTTIFGGIISFISLAVVFFLLLRENRVRRQAEVALRKSERKLTIRNKIANIFITIPDEGMYEEVLQVVLDVLESKYGVFGYLDNRGDFVVPTMTQSIWEKCQVPDKKFVFPHETWGDSSWPQAIREKRTIYSNDLSTNIPQGHISINRHISLPIIQKGEVVGLFQVANKESDYDEDDIELLNDIANHIAPILNARLQRDRQERERKQAEIALENANKELESFSYSVSHDLRAPLRSIDGFSLALLEDCADKIDETGKDYLNRIRLSTQRMAQLIDDMLKLSRITRMEMRRNTVDLSALAESLASELQKTETDRQVEFVISNGLTVDGDEHLLRIVLDNLLGNAMKYTSKHPRARIEFGSLPGDDSKPIFYVRDDGAGFDMKYAGKLFGAFQRLHSAAEFSGTGIGLATVQRIIHRHGGRVWAEGKLNEGATFYFTL